jgi:hypothetical protein
MILLLEFQGAFKIVEPFHSNYFGPGFSGSGGQVYVEDAVALLDEDKQRLHRYFLPSQRVAPGASAEEAINHLLKVGEKATDPIRSTSLH